MSRSSLMEFYRCPKRWLNGYESDDSKATEWGCLVDCLFLTPAQFRNRYAIAPDTYPDSKTGEPKPWNANSNWCKNWIEEQAPKEIIKHKLFGPACDAVKVLESDPEIKALMECSQRQVMATASYQDEETGITVSLKILIDLLPDKESQWGKSIMDFKTSESAALRNWRSKMFKFNYDAQNAFYFDVWEATTEKKGRTSVTSCRSLTRPTRRKSGYFGEFIEIGRIKYMKALALYCACLNSGMWPGYDSDCRQSTAGS